MGEIKRGGVRNQEASAKMNKTPIICISNNCKLSSSEGTHDMLIMICKLKNISWINPAAQHFKRSYSVNPLHPASYGAVSASIVVSHPWDARQGC